MTTIAPIGPQRPSVSAAPPVQSNVDSNSPTAQTTTQGPAPQPVYSPTTHVDPSTGIAVLVELDSTGEIIQQLPSKQVVEEYRRHQGPNVPASINKAAVEPAIKSADISGQANSSSQNNTDTSTQH